MRRLALAALLSLPCLAVAQSAPKTAQFHLINSSGIGAPVGQVTFEETAWGLFITPELHGLPPGLHGFHLHQQPHCGPGEKDGRPAAGLAAGDHYDPDGAARHRGPYHEPGHRGDLPALYVDAEGHARTPVLAPRLKLRDLMGRSVMVHKGGDNYDDRPEPLGGGGERIACAVVGLR